MIVKYSSTVTIMTLFTRNVFRFLTKFHMASSSRSVIASRCTANRALNGMYVPHEPPCETCFLADAMRCDTRLTHTEQVDLPNVRLAATQRHFLYFFSSIFLYRVGSTWNQMPSDLSNVTSLFTFKQAFRKQRLQNKV